MATIWRLKAKDSGNVDENQPAKIESDQAAGESVIVAATAAKMAGVKA